MGWSYSTNTEGREIGYSVTANCDRRGCHAIIDRGLAYVCGGMHDADWGVGCGKYFCTDHLFLTGVEGAEKAIEGPRAFMCGECTDKWEAEAKQSCLECGHLGLNHDRRAEPHKHDDPQPVCNVPGCACDIWESPDG